MNSRCRPMLIDPQSGYLPLPKIYHLLFLDYAKIFHTISSKMSLYHDEFNFMVTARRIRMAKQIRRLTIPIRLNSSGFSAYISNSNS